MRRSPTTTERVDIHGLTSGRCLFCREFVPIESMEVDHLYPVSKGGSSNIKNLVPACRECNRKKHARIVMDNAPSPVKSRGKGIPKAENRARQIKERIYKVRCLLEDIESKLGDMY